MHSLQLWLVFYSLQSSFIYFYICHLIINCIYSLSLSDRTWSFGMGDSRSLVLSSSFILFRSILLAYVFITVSSAFSLSLYSFHHRVLHFRTNLFACLYIIVSSAFSLVCLWSLLAPLIISVICHHLFLCLLITSFSYFLLNVFLRFLRLSCSFSLHIFSLFLLIWLHAFSPSVSRVLK
jgi:hypothetical protein